MDGFRPGKVPLPILRKRFGEVAATEALKKIVAVSYEKVLKEKNILALGDPDVKVGESLPEEKNPFSFQVTVEVWPEVKVENYKGLTIEREKIEIRDEEVEEVLRMRQEENAEFLPVEGRPVKDDDWVVIDFRSFLDGSPFQNGEGSLFRLGLGAFPKEVEDVLIGSLPETEEEREIEVPLPGQGSPARKILYRIKLRGIKERRLLIVDDEFARDLGEFNNIAELRADIRKKLENRAREEEEGKLRSKIVELLVEKNEMEIPSYLVEEQLKYLMLVSQAELSSSGEGEKKSELREKLRPLAVTQVKSSLILEEIARRENLTVTEEEIKKEVEGTRALSAKGKREDLAYRIKRRKVLDFLISRAEIKEKKKSLVLTPDQVRMLMPQEEKSRGRDRGRIIVP